MLTKIKMKIAKNRNMLNITSFTFISFLLLIVSYFIDYRGFEFRQYVPDQLMLSKDVSTTFLTTLAGVFLTVTTFTLTTILSILNQYANSFTPRAMQKFIDKPYVLSLFGIFIGGFFYSIFSLLMIQNVPDKVKVISGSIGILYAMASMIYFILFVKTVLKSIKARDVIEDIYDRALKCVKDDASLDETVSTDFSLEEYNQDITRIYAKDSGYLYAIDDDKLAKILKDGQLSLMINYKVGDYLVRGMNVANLNIDIREAEYDKADDLAEKISSCFIYSESPNDTDDYRHEVKNLVEIALRAISPGINDPNTAIICIRKISMLLSVLFSHKSNYKVKVLDDSSKIIYKEFTVHDELYFNFYQLIHYGKEDPSVARNILNGLNLIFMHSSQNSAQEVKKFYDEAYEIFMASMASEMDKNHLKSLKENFYQLTDNLD